MRTIVWFREKDLRLSDHRPLREALKTGEVIPLYIVDACHLSPQAAGQRPHATQYLLDALVELAAQIARRGSRLVLSPDEGKRTVPRLLERFKAQRVVAHSIVDPDRREQDQLLREQLGHRLELFDGETLRTPGTLRTVAGKPYSVYSRFARAFGQSTIVSAPAPSPKSLPPLSDVLALDSMELPTARGLGLVRNPAVLPGGETAARKRLRQFLKGPAANYEAGRDRMDQAGTSRLSADLVFGTISVRQVWNAVEDALGSSPVAGSFLNQLIWREFNLSTLRDRPQILTSPFRPEFAAFPWRDDKVLWQAWVAGRTGYPIVDASARQLLGEGYVHNRARMISASFLSKHLLIYYRHGEAHYMRYLADGDRAQNNAGWQWSAGCGCDAQPYFRVFNPVLQGRKFDPHGDYVRRWVPELARMPARYIHRPWEAPQNVLDEAGVRLGEDYFLPVVGHRPARERFLSLAREHLRRHRATTVAA